jgi:N-acetylneuraminate lyase
VPNAAHRRFQGLVAAPFTPFHADGTVHEDAIDRQSERLIADGVDGAFVCGTTGEGPSLTTAERMLVASRWAGARRRLKLFVHVGHSSAADARTLAAHAQSIGADAIACLAPFFFKPRTAGELAAFCRHVAAAAPDLPFYYYHIPSLTGVSLAMRDFLPEAVRRSSICPPPPRTTCAPTLPQPVFSPPESGRRTRANAAGKDDSWVG